MICEVLGCTLMTGHPGECVRRPIELVHHPGHYQPGVYEVYKIIEAHHLGFHLGNALKYILRAGKKPGEPLLRDLEKARWYLDREIQRQKENT